MENFIETLTKYNIDPIMVIMYVAAGFFCKTYLKRFTNITITGKKIKVDTAWKTLGVGTLFIIIYVGLLLAAEQLPKESYIKIIFSYVVATSFYEIIIKPVQRFITYIAGGEQDKAPSK